MMLRYGRHLRLIALWAMLLPFVLSSFIATSVMPARAADGVVMFVICTGEGMVEKAFNSETMEPVSKSDQHGSKFSGCDWAAAQHPVDLLPITMPGLPDSLAMSSQNPFHQTILMQAAATGLPPSTGPPSVI